MNALSQLLLIGLPIGFTGDPEAAAAFSFRLYCAVCSLINIAPPDTEI
jgi:hypothetical protein